MKFIVVVLAVVSAVVALPPPDQLAALHGTSHSSSLYGVNQAASPSGATHTATIIPVAPVHGNHGHNAAYLGHNTAYLIPAHSGALHGGAYHHAASAPAISSAYSAGYHQGVLNSHLAAHGHLPHQAGHHGAAVLVGAIPAHQVIHPANHGKY